MTDRLSVITAPCRLFNAGPTQTSCADQVSKWLLTTKPPSLAGTAWRQSPKTRMGSAAQNEKRPADIDVATTGDALSP